MFTTVVCGITAGEAKGWMAVDLSALFGKAAAASVQVSPMGGWIGWLARSDGVLNLYVARLPLPPEERSFARPGGVRSL